MISKCIVQNYFSFECARAKASEFLDFHVWESHNSIIIIIIIVIIILL